MLSGSSPRNPHHEYSNYVNELTAKRKPPKRVASCFFAGPAPAVRHLRAGHRRANGGPTSPRTLGIQMSRRLDGVFLHPTDHDEGGFSAVHEEVARPPKRLHNGA
jgi:hypothetical protein